MVPAVVGAHSQGLGNSAGLYCDSQYLEEIFKLKCSLLIFESELNSTPQWGLGEKKCENINALQMLQLLLKQAAKDCQPHLATATVGDANICPIPSNFFVIPTQNNTT